MIDEEVLSYYHSVIDDNYISKLRSNNQISSIGNEEDIVLEPCVVGGRICITRPRGVPDKNFYFYSGVIEDFKIHIPFTDFKFDLLKTLNVVPYQLSPNGWGFIKAFEPVCEMVDISSILGLIFSFFELKGVEKGGLVFFSGILRKSFLQAYTTNYKGFKDKFLQLKSGKGSPKLCVRWTGTTVSRFTGLIAHYRFSVLIMKN